MLYLSGRAIHRASEGYRGEGKTDAKDAAVIADQARIRRDLHPLRTGDEVGIATPSYQEAILSAVSGGFAVPLLKHVG